LSELEPAGAQLGQFAAHIAPVEGRCDEHGAATILTRNGLPWQCPACLDAKLKAEFAREAISERQAHLHKIADLPAKHRGHEFKARTPEQKAVGMMVVSFRDFIISQPGWATLIMVGENGTGKTLMVTQFAESLIAKYGKSVRYVTAASMISEIQSCYGREGRSAEVAMLEFAQYDLLIIDEIDMIRDKDDAKILLTEVVSKRYNAERPIVAISNQTLDTLGQFIGDRIVSRLHENSFFCLFDWPDFRRQS
jgi:DNA replication protein DnaC